MSEDNKCIEVRTAVEESLVAVLAEACYVDGGTPKDFRELIEKDPDLSAMYNKEHYIFKKPVQRVEYPYHESTDVI